jgi:hypothetical protein
MKDILNYRTKKKGSNNSKEFETGKSGNIKDITEEKFRLKLIDHYHRMLQNVLQMKFSLTLFTN